jgi:6-phosphofructokinase
MSPLAPASDNQQPLNGGAAMMLSSARRNLRTTLDHPLITQEQRATAEARMMATDDAQQVMKMRVAVYNYIQRGGAPGTADESTQIAA